MGISGSIVHPKNAIIDANASTFEGVSPMSGTVPHDWWNGSTLCDFGNSPGETSRLPLATLKREQQILTC